jgi:hypothetical protein
MLHRVGRFIAEPIDKPSWRLYSLLTLDTTSGSRWEPAEETTMDRTIEVELETANGPKVLVYGEWD